MAMLRAVIPLGGKLHSKHRNEPESPMALPLSSVAALHILDYPIQELKKKLRC